MFFCRHHAFTNILGHFNDICSCAAGTTQLKKEGEIRRNGTSTSKNSQMRRINTIRTCSTSRSLRRVTTTFPTTSSSIFLSSRECCVRLRCGGEYVGGFLVRGCTCEQCMHETSFGLCTRMSGRTGCMSMSAVHERTLMNEDLPNH